ncbi:MipA/OmpV family protein [Erythrobacter westpacificensis]|uniref:MipA/OmpV family protein n=1 Tax=Erythrobacter westpacificensis TaxID=1055231 RepID=A0ABP9JZZ6_9SPHN
MKTRTFSPAAIACGAIVNALFASPALAQDDVEVQGPPDIDMQETVFAGDYLSVGAGVALNPSYSGSDDYVFTVLPIVQGSLGGVDINPRAGGVTLDFVQDPDEGVGLDLGLAARLRSNRASQIEDEVVIDYGELDRAIEVGPSVGVNFPGVLNPYDSIRVGVDAMWDVNGAHSGMTVSPSVSYSTPLSRSIFANLSVSTEWADADFQDYYFRVDDAAFIGDGVAPLPEFEPRGGGFTSAGVNLLLGIDLDGDIANGGLGLVVIGGYSRVLGDAADTPFTDIRGSKNQFLGALGIGYTF